MAATLPRIQGSTKVGHSTLENALMKYQMNGIGRSPLLAASILLCGLFAAVCDDHIDVIRNPNIPVVKGSTCARSEEHTSELQSLRHLVCRLLLEKKKEIQRKMRF